MPDDPLWFRFELLLKRHEPETVAQIQRLVKPGMNVLDIGAHVGYYARMLGTLTGDGGRVYAFEPHPRTYKMLCANIAALNNVTPVNAAVAEQEGTAELFDYLMMSASGSLHFDESMRDLQKAQLGSGDIAPRIEHDFPVEKFTVRTLALDDFLAEKGVTHIDFIKMDIEGAEIGALRGLRRTIAQSPGLQLIMEYNPQALKAFGHDPAAAFDEVLALGFTRAQIVHEDGTLSDVQRDALAALTGQLMQNMGVVNVLLTR
jgi:FkbM family methyltransferase